ncbi:hypothetical protein SETIT_8G247600v2 [Setaria italica]|uniref:Alpha/beta hydrolase fold-3 domain-containing protein n=1 Tax=Setaria italica TaxID=4555 RepID=K3ZIU4_SETIT|nr:probable carboxylesterase 12 [Setaria italica]RCV39741.1 hypothetical protein SETIT_8G247600v2 [Setaria italica]
MIRSRPTLFSRARTHQAGAQIPVSIHGHKTSLLSNKAHLLAAAAGRRSIPSRRLVAGPALAMDPASSEEIIIDSRYFRIYGDRRIDRLVGTTTVPPGFDAATGVTSRDVTIDADTGLYVRLYLPADTSSKQQNDKKLPLLVYFHGGAFVTQSAAAPAYQPFLSTLAARAGLLVVSVNYRLAPEHPFPAGYEDSLRALEWAVAGGGGDPWLSRHGDLGRVFLAGESAGGNIAHNVAMMAAAGEAAAAVEGAAVLHALFSGREPVDGELPMWVESLGKLWAVVCPEAAEGTDDPRMNPAAAPANLRRMPCRRVLVCAAEKDFGAPRCRAYYEALKASGWGGEVEWFESKGEDHVFFLAKPADDDVVAELMDRLVAFFTATGGN